MRVFLSSLTLWLHLLTISLCGSSHPSSGYRSVDKQRPGRRRSASKTRYVRVRCRGADWLCTGLRDVLSLPDLLEGQSSGEFVLLSRVCFVKDSRIEASLLFTYLSPKGTFAQNRFKEALTTLKDQLRTNGFDLSAREWSQIQHEPSTIQQSAIRWVRGVEAGMLF